MPIHDPLKEAERVMTICNACRYCEGYCAVFPAMELRRTFSTRYLKYLSNLCHNCRGCFYACQYAPPHEFTLNVPKTMAELRLQTYQEFCWPAVLGIVFQKNAWVISCFTVICIALVSGLTLAVCGPTVFFGFHTGPDAFYHVISYPAVVLPFSALAVLILVIIGKETLNFWQESGCRSDDWPDYLAHLKAVRDTLQLRYLDGGGYGCNYPDDRFTMIRRYFHHAIFYGFMLCLASTTLAAIYAHILDLPAPYPFWSLPVLLGTAGGAGLLAGTGGMLYLKTGMNREAADSRSLSMDTAFTIVLFLTSLTGLLLLLLRATPFMGTLLTTHLGMVLGFFTLMPYSKFIHGVYRYAALVRHAHDQSRGRVIK